MAKYLNHIDLTKNQLQNAVVHPLGTAPTTPADGQIYYNTTNGDKSIYVYDAEISQWKSISGDLTGVAQGTAITITNANGPVPTINHANVSRTNDTATDTLTYGGSFYAYTDVNTNAQGHVISTEVTTFTLPASDNTTYDLNVPTATTSIRLTGSDSTEDNVTISGTSNEVDVTRVSNTELRIGLPDNVTIAGDTTINGNLVVEGSDFEFNGSNFSIISNTAIDLGGSVINGVGTPLSSSDAATKQYVDQAVTGSLSYQGGYNANTNTPDLDSSPSAAIKKGWTYTVTADGDFFTEQVRVGDVLIAENDAPTTLAEWTTVQNNIDLADASTVGIGNVNAGTGISVSYSNGTATVTNTETNSSNSATGTITAGQTSGTVTHTFGVNTIVQTIDSSGNTVYCDISRTATTSTATISTAEATDITILVQKIG